MTRLSSKSAYEASADRHQATFPFLFRQSAYPWLETIHWIAYRSASTTVSAVSGPAYRNPAEFQSSTISIDCFELSSAILIGRIDSSSGLFAWQSPEAA